MKLLPLPMFARIFIALLVMTISALVLIAATFGAYQERVTALTLAPMWAAAIRTEAQQPGPARQAGPRKEAQAPTAYRALGYRSIILTVKKMTGLRRDGRIVDFHALSTRFPRRGTAQRSGAPTDLTECWLRVPFPDGRLAAFATTGRAPTIRTTSSRTSTGASCGRSRSSAPGRT